MTASAPTTYEPRIHAATVTAVRTLGPGMVRVTLGGEDMHDYPTTAVGDEYVRLFFPDEPHAQVRMPFVTENGWDFPEGVEPAQMRTYTIREHRPGEVDVDFVVHEGGIAAAWALQATPGQQLALNPPRELYDRPERATRQVLVADEPALPAALRIAELTAHEVATIVLVEVRGAEHELRGTFEGTDPCVYRWLRGTGNGIAPSELISALRREDLDENTYVWVAAETRLTRQARKLLRHERGLAPDAFKSVGYWTDKAEQWRERYEALGADFAAHVDSLWSSDRDIEEILDEVAEIYEGAGL